MAGLYHSYQPEAFANCRKKFSPVLCQTRTLARHLSGRTCLPASSLVSYRCFEIRRFPEAGDALNLLPEPKMILASAPSKYFEEIRKTAEFPFEAVLASHCLPAGEDSPFWTDDFDAFLAWREKRSCDR